MVYVDASTIVYTMTREVEVRIGGTPVTYINEEHSVLCISIPSIYGKGYPNENTNHNESTFYPRYMGKTSTFLMELAKGTPLTDEALSIALLNLLGHRSRRNIHPQFEPYHRLLNNFTGFAALKGLL